MAAFVRFVFTILIVGMVMNLAIVLVANVQSQRRRAAQDATNTTRFTELMAEIDRHARRADIIVESQRFDAHENVLESTLLVRQYHIVARVTVYNEDNGVAEAPQWHRGTSLDWPLPVERIVIPGDKLQATGLLLKFGDHFVCETGAYPMLSKAQLAFFGLFCGADEVAPTGPNAMDERFTYLPRELVPELIRLDGQFQGFDPKTPGIGFEPPPAHAANFLLKPQASFFELKLWQCLWSHMPEIPRDAKLPWPPISNAALRDGAFSFNWTGPATITVRLRHTYSAFISADDGVITLNEDLPGLPGLEGEMLEEGRKLNLQSDE